MWDSRSASFKKVHASFKKVHARCRVKVALCHNYIYCACIECMLFARYIHIGRNIVHGPPKLLVVKWLGLNATVRVRARARDRE